MKISRYFFSILAFILVFAILAIAQTEKTQNVNPIKIAFVYAIAFEDEKTGIKELAEIIKKLDEEFKPQTEELKMMYEKHQELRTELQKLADSYKLTGTTITKEFLDEKIKESESLNSEIEKKRKEIKSLYEKHKLEVTKEINKKIVEAIKQFAKEKDYEAIFDASVELLTYPQNFGKPDVTDEFIKYYNSLSAKQQ